MNITKSSWFAAASVAMLFQTAAAKDADMTFGGPGAGKGTFNVMKDIAFDAKDNLYVLDGVTVDNKTKVANGNALVQIFGNDGKFQRQFSIADTTPSGTANTPSQIAVARNGNVFVSQPGTGEVLMYSNDGKLLKRAAFPKAHALASCHRTGKDWIAAVAKQGRFNKDAREGGAPEIALIDAATGDIAHRVALSEPVLACEDLVVDSKGNFYLLSELTAEILKFSPKGELVGGIGAGRKTTEADGSVLLHSIAIDSKDNVYSITPGNPGSIIRFDPEFKVTRKRAGAFAWFDAWTGNLPAMLALDGTDRIWLAAPGNTAKGQRHHFRPAIIKTEAGFLDKVAEGTTRSIGLKTGVSSQLLHDISHEPGTPVNFKFKVHPARRNVTEITANYRIFDDRKKLLAEGALEIPLTDGVEENREIPFTPPAFGWYTILCDITSGGEFLQTAAKNIGVTPRFENMVSISEDMVGGGMNNIARQSFAGLRMMRVGVGVGKGAHDAFEKTLEQMEKYPDIHYYGFFGGVQDATPENIRAAVERFKGRVTHWEIVNEPNLGHVGPPEKYIDEYLRPARDIIKEIDPEAKIVGPNTCGIQIGWNKKFLELGGGDLVDVFSIHDYEGHESMDPVHWRWKYGELRKLIDEAGRKDVPIWQTERGWLGVRGGSFSPVAQAVRVMLHRDMLEVLGIPSENSMLYYLFIGGYASYPAYQWSENGPHISPVATRMREAQVKGMKYVGEMDFGATGNKIFMGLHYTGEKDDLYTVRNLGFADQRVAFTLKNAGAAKVMDWAGNAVNAPLAQGVMTLAIGQLPTYIRVPKGGALSPVPWDFGENIAPKAVITFNGDGPFEEKVFDKDGEVTSVNIHTNTALLNNGIMEVFHAEHPHGGTHGRSIFRINNVTNDYPHKLEITFPEPEEVSKLLVFSVRPDNAFSALHDFDVQYFDEAMKAWRTAKEVRTPIPESVRASSPGCSVYSWIDDTNAFVVQLDKPVKASRFRLSILKTSAGLLANDPVARKGRKDTPGINLREIEMYK